MSKFFTPAIRVIARLFFNPLKTNKNNCSVQKLAHYMTLNQWPKDVRCAID